VDFFDKKGGKMKMDKNRIRDLSWSVVGASIGIAIVLWFVADGRSPFLLASLGGSMVFLFALTETEAAQPRALFGGHLGGALIGILAFRFFGDALWVSVIAVVLTMVFMVITRTIHPPAGANPLFMVHNHAGIYVLLKPVLLGVGILFLVAFVQENLILSIGDDINFHIVPLNRLKLSGHTQIRLFSGSRFTLS
jgi:CBS-domain-containing membrane protein